MPSPTTADIRAWAQQNGHPVGDRGRLPAELVEAYDKAHRSGKTPAQAPTKTPPAARPASRPAADPAPVRPATSPPATPKPAEPEALAARLAAVEARLVEVTRRLETLENAPRGLFGRRRA